MIVLTNEPAKANENYIAEIIFNGAGAEKYDSWQFKKNREFSTLFPFHDAALSFSLFTLKPFTISHTAVVTRIGNIGIAISPINGYPNNIMNVTPVNCSITPIIPITPNRTGSSLNRNREI